MVKSQENIWTMYNIHWYIFFKKTNELKLSKEPIVKRRPIATPKYLLPSLLNISLNWSFLFEAETAIAINSFLLHSYSKDIDFFHNHIWYICTKNAGLSIRYILCFSIPANLNNTCADPVSNYFHHHSFPAVWKSCNPIFLPLSCLFFSNESRDFHIVSSLLFSF